MNIELILRVVLLAAVMLGVTIAFFASRAKTRRARGVLIAAVVAWSLFTIGGGIALQSKIGVILITEGLLLAGVPILAILAGLSIGSTTRSRTVRSLLAAVFAVFAILDLSKFYGLNQTVIDMAGSLGIGKSNGKIEPAANKECPENLKMIYFSFAQYVDGNGSLPKADKWMDNEEIASKIQKDEWLHCPEVSNRKDDKFGYAYNDAIAGRDMRGKKLSEMPNAATTPLLYDSSNLSRSAHDPFKSLPSAGRHAGSNNVLYCDGHVELVSPGAKQ